jgi:hypothetical protein
MPSVGLLLQAVNGTTATPEKRRIMSGIDIGEGVQRGRSAQASLSSLLRFGSFTVERGAPEPGMILGDRFRYNPLHAAAERLPLESLRSSV